MPLQSLTSFWFPIIFTIKQDNEDPLYSAFTYPPPSLIFYYCCRGTLNSIPTTCISLHIPQSPHYLQYFCFFSMAQLLLILPFRHHILRETSSSLQAGLDPSTVPSLQLPVHCLNTSSILLSYRGIYLRLVPDHELT